MSPSPETTTTTLTVTDLHKSFRTFKALDGVSFTLDGGSTTVVGGINGSGKSTLLRCLAGLSNFAGSVLLGDLEITRNAGPELRNLVSYLPQLPGFPESGTVAEVLLLFSELRGAPLDEVPLPDGFLPRLDARLRTLSGGQQQRVALTIAMLGEPRLLLLDEPTANLDQIGRGAVWEAIEAFKAAGSIVVIASPAPSELESGADKIIELAEGRIVNIQEVAR